MRSFIIWAILISTIPLSAKQKSSSNDIVMLKIKLSTKGSDISFDKTAIEAPFGKEIQITYTNEADANSELSHNVAIIKLGSEQKLFANLRKIDDDIEKIDQSLLIVKTKVLNPGEKDTITFRPAALGTYTYICLMPNHGTMLGMKGTLKIVPAEKVSK